MPKDLEKVKDECTGKACKYFAAGYCKKRDYCRYSHDIEVCARAFPKKRKKPKTKALHMSVLGQDQFISKITCLLGTHPDPWTKEKHWGRGCGQNCPCCRAHNEEDWPTGCAFCVQMWYLTCINKQWRDRTRELPMLPESKRRRKGLATLLSLTPSLPPSLLFNGQHPVQWAVDLIDDPCVDHLKNWYLCF